MWVHIVLMAAAAVSVLTAVSAARGKKTGWLKKHKAMALTGVACAVAAFAVIFVSKVQMHFPHFHSVHSVIGLTALVFLVAAPVTGALVASGAGRLRIAHRWFGRTASLAVVLAVLSGIFRMVQILKR